MTLPKGTTVDSPGVAAELDAALAKVQAALPDARIASYGSTGDPAFVSEDRRTSYALVYIPQLPGLEPGQAEARQAQAALDGVTVGGSPVEVTGLEALRAASAAGEGDTSVSVLLEVLVAGAGALIVLVFVFSSLMAIVPLLMAAVAIPTTFLLVWPLTGVTDVSIVIQFLVALVGLGIAIDYALLVVMRWREERDNGATGEEAVEKAMAHAGWSVVFSGTTVAIALLALLIFPVPFLRSIAIAGAFIPLVSVAVAITLLPVVLATIGPRLDWPRVRRADRAGASGPPGPGSSSAIAGSRPSRRPPCSCCSRPPPSRSSSGARAPSRSASRAPRAPASRSSRRSGSAPDRCRRSRRSCAAAIPRRSPRRSRRRRRAERRSPRPTGAATARRS